jgi:hypothetical protein
MSIRLASIVPVLLACAEPSALICGDGTVEMEGRCLPIVSCGPGTIVVGDVCVPESMLACGSGTMQLGDECVPTGLECPPGTIQRGDDCLAADLVVVRMPFEVGYAVQVTQGMHGNVSHAGSQVHALDFAAEIGTTVVAARDGVVVDLEEDSSTTCTEEGCAELANYVRVDHGDGTYSKYFHLDTNGALVAVGDRVCAGEPIARSGNTGWSTGPHLHFQVEDAFGYSLPLYFEELGDTTEGWLFAGITVESTNAPPATCDHTIEPADCPPDLFAHDGIVELAGMPCALAERTTYRVTGRALGEARTGQLGMRGDLDSAWSYGCGTTESDGTFAIDLTFPPDRVDVRAFATITSAGAGNCTSSDGWDTAPRIVVR